MACWVLGLRRESSAAVEPGQVLTMSSVPASDRVSSPSANSSSASGIIRA